MRVRVRRTRGSSIVRMTSAAPVPALTMPPVYRFLSGVPEGRPFFVVGGRPVLLDSAVGVSVVAGLSSLERAPFIHGGSTAEGWRPVSGWAFVRGVRFLGGVVPSDAVVDPAGLPPVLCASGVFVWSRVGDGVLLCFQGGCVADSAAELPGGVPVQVCGGKEDSGPSFRRVPLVKAVGLVVPSWGDLVGSPEVADVGSVVLRVGRSSWRVLDRACHVAPVDVRRGMAAFRGRPRRVAASWGGQR